MDLTTPTTKNSGFWSAEDKKQLQLDLELRARDFAARGIMTAADMRSELEEKEPKFKTIDSHPFDGIFTLYEAIIKSRGYKPSTSSLKPGDTSDD